jgi:amino acid transporter
LKNPLSHILQYDSSRPQYFIAFLVLVVIFISSVLIHIGAIANSYLRINRIENYYNSFIVIPEEIEQLKKKTNKRDMIIFLLCALIIGLIIFIVYKKVKASKESKVQLVAMPK